MTKCVATKAYTSSMLTSSANIGGALPPPSAGDVLEKAPTLVRKMDVPRTGDGGEAATGSPPAAPADWPPAAAGWLPRTPGCSTGIVSSTTQRAAHFRAAPSCPTCMYRTPVSCIAWTSIASHHIPFGSSIACTHCISSLSKWSTYGQTC